MPEGFMCSCVHVFMSSCVHVFMCSCVHVFRGEKVRAAYGQGLVSGEAMHDGNIKQVH